MLPPSFFPVPSYCRDDERGRMHDAFTEYMTRLKACYNVEMWTGKSGRTDASLAYDVETISKFILPRYFVNRGQGMFTMLLFLPALWEDSL